MNAEFHYRYTRRDFVQACIVLMRKPAWRNVLDIAIWLAIVIVGQGVISGDPARIGRAAVLIFGGHMPLFVYMILAGMFVVLWFRHILYGWLICAPVFGKQAHANRDVFLRVDEVGIVGGTDDFHTQIQWEAIKRVVATPDTVVLAASKREGVVLPRRAVGTQAEWDAFIVYANARVTAGKAKPSPAGR